MQHNKNNLENTDYLLGLLKEALEVYKLAENRENKKFLDKVARKEPKNIESFSKLCATLEDTIRNPKGIGRVTDEAAVEHITAVLENRLVDKIQAYAKSIKGSVTIKGERAAENRELKKHKYVEMEKYDPRKSTATGRKFVEMLNKEQDKHHESRLLLTIYQESSKMLPKEKQSQFTNAPLQFSDLNKSRYSNILTAKAQHQEKMEKSENKHRQQDFRPGGKYY